MNLVLWHKDFTADNKKLRITFLDVGQGDCILLEFPDKGTMLIDGGTSGIEGAADMGKNVVAPFLWNKGIKRLDAVVVSHFHEDHVGGLLYILKNFDVGRVIDSGAAPGGDRRLYDEYIDVVIQRGIRRLVVASGDEITGFQDVKLFVINPPPDEQFADPNDNSIVIKLKLKDYSLLFCGDISSKAMERVLSYRSLLKSDVLKIPHHGGSIGEEWVAGNFFEDVSPSVTVTSSGGKFHSGYSSKTVAGLNSVNYNTKFNGAIKITTDGSKFEVRPFCPSTLRQAQGRPERSRRTTSSRQNPKN